jgi:hypothetical protein
VLSFEQTSCTIRIEMVDYICTNCTQPTPSLYKVYSTPGSIQLTTCKSCHHDVDPYIEREWLLVLMDCILHRSEAFRHLLYNREPFCKFASADGMSEYRALLLQMLTGTYFLRMCLWYAELFGENGNEKMNNDSDSERAMIVMMQMLIGDFILITSTILTGIMMLRNSVSMKDEKEQKSNGPTTLHRLDSLFISRIYLAISIPNLFHAVTLTVTIWERSYTIFMLGYLFVLSLQRMGVAIVMEERYSNRRTEQVVEVARRSGKRQQNQIVSSYITQSFPFMIGIMICILLQASGIRDLRLEAIHKPIHAADAIDVSF